MIDSQFCNSSTCYLYGFQGQEKDDEVKGEGNSVNYKYRMHDPRIGRFFAVDPFAPKYPYYTPYSFSGNQVIHAVELEGLEPSYVNVEDADVNEMYQGSDKSSTESSDKGKIFNYSVNIDDNGVRNWKKGTQYQGPNPKESAFLAQDIYNYDDFSEGYSVIKNAEKVKEYKIQNVTVKNDGFVMGLYKRNIDGVYFSAVVFAGTEFTSVKDWKANILQGLGLYSSQYQRASWVGIRYRYFTGNVTFIGHSLGGGLATTAALESGKRAITFNAAGLTSSTKDKYSLHGLSTSKIDAYVIQNEVLNSYLAPMGQGAVGNKIDLVSTIPILTYRAFTKDYYSNGGGILPSSIKYKEYLDLWQLQNHGMSEVIKSMGY